MVNTTKQPTKPDADRLYTELKPKYNKFFELMPNRVQNVLLVASIYDSYMLEEDGRLSDQIYEEFQNLFLRTLPRITRVSSASEALELLESGKKFDLIITMRRLGEMDAFSFGRKVKEKFAIPVVLLLNSVVEVNYLPEPDKRTGVDRVFVWNGDSKIFVAIIKHLEDKLNVDHDIDIANVRVFLFVEDSIRYSSLLLPELYAEIMKQTHDLLTEGTNDFHDLLKMRIRPKILLTDNLEEALEYYHKYRDNILGVITDVEFYHHGKVDKTAGFKLAETIKNESLTTPVAIQSSNPEHRLRAEQIGCFFMNKSSHGLVWDLKRWLLDYVGFGSFNFKTSNGEVVARAKDVIEFYHALKEVPLESLYYHGSNDHFSGWLHARGEFEIAAVLKPRKVSEFKGEELRQFLLEKFYTIVKEKTRGMINDFSRENYHPEMLFIRLRPGSLGGKGRGIAFLMFVLNAFPIQEEFPDVSIDIPRTIAIGTNEFDRFMEENGLYYVINADLSDEEIKKRFVQAKLSNDLRDDLKFLLQYFTQPLAVRSSSILEDSAYQPFAGIFDTYMLPNNSVNIDERLEQLCTAIKLVFASPFFQQAKAYSQAINQLAEESKMAVIIQEVVGKPHNGLYYPDVSGTASSYNFYPIGNKMKPEDRVAHLAFGLGKIIVDDGISFTFCPKYPEANFYSTEDMLLQTSQKWFYAIDLDMKDFDLSRTDPYVKKYPITDAIKHGTLVNVADTYDFNDQMLKPGYYGRGSPVLTFSQLLKYNKIPIARLLNRILETGERTMGSSAEIEYALNISEDPNEPHQFYLLQIRPFLQQEVMANESIDNIPDDAIIIQSPDVSGNLYIENITDFIYVKPQTFDNSKTIEMLQEVDHLNHIAKEEGWNYVLIGVGRWGSADRFLGIPAKWNNISQAKVIVETCLDNFHVDFSQGSHFFHNIVTANVGYLHIKHGTDKHKIKWDWLNSQTILHDLKYLRHVKTKENVTVFIDAYKHIGAIFISKKEYS